MPREDSTFLVWKEERKMIFYHRKCGSRIQFKKIPYPGEEDPTSFYVLDCPQAKNCMRSGEITIMNKEAYDKLMTALDRLSPGGQIVVCRELSMESFDIGERIVVQREGGMGNIAPSEKTISSQTTEILEKVHTPL